MLKLILQHSCMRSAGFESIFVWFSFNCQKFIFIKYYNNIKKKINKTKKHTNKKQNKKPNQIIISHYRGVRFPLYPTGTWPLLIYLYSVVLHCSADTFSKITPTDQTRFSAINRIIAHNTNGKIKYFMKFNQSKQDKVINAESYSNIKHFLSHSCLCISV